MKPMSRMRGLWSTLAAILLIMGCRPATSRESSAASPDAPPTSQVTEEASGQPSQDSTGPLEWKDAGVGSPQQAGRHTWDRKTLTLSGTGAGLDVKGQDQVQFAYLSGRSGDFEIVGRLVDISGEGDAAAGIMVRQDSAANGAMAALHYTSQGQKLGWKSRVPGKSSGETSRVFSGGIALARRAPLWLKMVRVGPNLAVYKLRDGELWTMISNVSGGPIALEGPFDLGFFATSSGDGKPVTATFDSIRIGPAPAVQNELGRQHVRLPRGRQPRLQRSVGDVGQPGWHVLYEFLLGRGGTTRHVVPRWEGAQGASHRHAADGRGGHHRRRPARLRGGRRSHHRARSRRARLRAQAAGALREPSGQESQSVRGQRHGLQRA